MELRDEAVKLVNIANKDNRESYEKRMNKVAKSIQKEDRIKSLVVELYTHLHETIPYKIKEAASKGATKTRIYEWIYYQTYDDILVSLLLHGSLMWKMCSDGHYRKGQDYITYCLNRAMFAFSAVPSDVPIIAFLKSKYPGITFELIYWLKYLGDNNQEAIIDASW